MLDMGWVLSLFLLTSAAGFSLEDKQQKNFADAKEKFSSSVLKGWSFDYVAALKASREENKFLILAFVGSTWCPWSKKLISEVLASPALVQSLEKEALFVCLDFPPLASTSPQQMSVKDAYGVEEFPCFVIVHPSGEVVAKVGFLPMLTQKFVDLFSVRIANYQEVKNAITQDLSRCSEEKLEDLYRKAQTIAEAHYREKILHIGLKKKGNIFFLLQHYEELLKTHRFKDEAVQVCRQKILEIDPHNHKKTQFHRAMLEFQVLSISLAKKRLEKAIQPLVEYIEVHGASDKENLWKAEMTIAQFLFSRGQYEKALMHAEASLRAAPDPFKEEIVLTVDYLKSRKYEVESIK